MQYRLYGKDGPEVSRLGFGVMRLPLRKRGDWGRVNFSKSVTVMRRAMEAGVNFFDSHHTYHKGFSEVAIGRALKGWKGRRIYIQTKTPIYEPKPLRHFKRLVEEALEKTGVNALDYLLFHSMSLEQFKRRARMFFKLTDWAMKKGYIRFRGFSSHEKPEHIRRFIDTGEFSCVLMSFNWLNREVEETIAYAAARGLGVSIMNPVGGGSLAADTPQVLRLLPRARSGAEVAFRYVLSTPGVTLALSGMNTLEQVAENTAIAGRRTTMTDRQRRYMRQRLKTLRRKSMKICTACGYCMPCPHGVDIPQNFLLLNQARLFGLIESSRRGFKRLLQRPGGDASALACRRCGRCLPKCPNHVPIMDHLAETVQLLGRQPIIPR